MPVLQKMPHKLLQGSDAAMKGRGRKDLQFGNVVEEYKVGNTLIQIDDFYFRDNTPEQNQVIIDQFYATGRQLVQTIFDKDPQHEIFKPKAVQ